MALPKHLTPDRMVRVAITACHRTPALLECSPLSILGCVIQAAELGLELSGVLGQAYMVPYWNKDTRQKEAQFQVGYRGLMDLAYRSGRVQTFCAHCVYEGDRFQFQYGSHPKIVHVPCMQAIGPEKVTAVYAVLNLKGGGFDFEVMSKEQIEAHRKRYSKAKSASGPWETAWEEMAKKTVIRRLAKRAPVSVEVQRAAVLDEYSESGLSQGLGMELGIGLEASATSTPPENGRHRLGQSEPLIDDAQAERLAELLAEHQADGSELCMAFSVPVLRKLPASAFDAACEWITQQKQTAES